jgi:hypothetical protein
MRPETAYKKLNALLWQSRLPEAKIDFLEDDVIPTCYGITLFDCDFAKPVIFLNAGNKLWGRTLVHEMVHVAEPLLPHGKTFNYLVDKYWQIARKNIKGLK